MLCERLLYWLPVLASLLGVFVAPTKGIAEVYELRTYTTNEGKLATSRLVFETTL
jgi:hypothetical protein